MFGKFLMIGAAVGAVFLSLSSVSGQGANLTGKVDIDGSSTVFPLTEAVAAEFQRANSGVKVTVGVSGTGGGFKKFSRGETHGSNASRPIKSKGEADVAAENGVKYIGMPVAVDALTVVINKENTWATEMTVEELKKIWEPEADGKILKWNQVRAAWPDEKIGLYGPGTDSGTFDYFTEVINGKSQASRKDFLASEDDHVIIKGVEGSKYALGYFGYSYYMANKDKLTAVSVKDKGGDKFVAPSDATVNDGTYKPLARPIYFYASIKALERPEFVKFVEFYLDNTTRLAKRVGMVPLPADVLKRTKKAFEDRKEGDVPFVAKKEEPKKDAAK